MAAEALRPALAGSGISKRFAAVVANDRIDFDVRFGEVHALIGENGAGKSTLMGVLYGLLRPDAGTIEVRGRPAHFDSCADAMRAGIGMVFQHFLLVERFSVAQNVLLGREPSSGGFVDEKSARTAVREIAARYGFALDPGARIEDLGVGARQQVELLKVLERDAKIVILDEPSAALSPAESAALFDVVRRLRDEGRAIIFIAHKLKEVLAVADRITVLRQGRVVGSVARADADESKLATMMVGRHFDVNARLPRAAPAAAGGALRVADFVVARDDGAPSVRGMDLVAAQSEIVGIAGVEGNGQLEFAEALYGIRSAAGGSIEWKGEDISRLTPAERRARGFRYIPADRQREGLVLDFDTSENALLGDQRRLRRGLLVNAKLARERADEIGRDYQLAGYSPTNPARSYSGGTQQKLIVGRELGPEAKLVIAFAPTRGVDVGATAAIHARLRAVRDAGACVILISYDLDEIRALADRIVVFGSGRVVGELKPQDASDAALGRLMGGVTAHA